MRLSAFEYQCGHGVGIGEATARKLGREAMRCGVKLSLHAPYYINLSGTNEDRRAANTEYILAAARAASWMGATRVVVHMGSAGDDREAALLRTIVHVKSLVVEVDKAVSGVNLCLETMGKVAQLGTLAELLTVCQSDDRLIPCVDFGHLYARERGARFINENDFDAALTEIEMALGMGRARFLHIHFSHIAYNRGGEWKHVTFADEEIGPPHKPLMTLLAKRGYAPTIICESRGTQDSDACVLRDTYLAEQSRSESKAEDRR